MLSCTSRTLKELILFSINLEILVPNLEILTVISETGSERMTKEKGEK